MKKNMFWIGILFIFTAVFFSGSATALFVNNTDNASVSVTVSTLTMVDISPNVLSWTVNPGAACGLNLTGGTCNETNKYYAVQIENIGSHNISNAWFNVTTPASNPIASGSAANTNSGDYVMLANESSGSFYFVVKKEFNETRSVVYLTDPDGNMPPNSSKYTYGRFHNGSSEYFWIINATPASGCWNSPILYIGNLAHTKTQTGAVAFNNPANYNSFTMTIYDATTISGNSSAYAAITAGPLTGYCASVTNSTCQLYFSGWNADAPFDKCSNVRYAWNSTNEGPLVPGNSFAMRIGVHVPQGIYEGASNPGQLTVSVNSVP